MKKIKWLMLAMALILAAAPSFAGNLTFTGRAGMFTPNGGSSSLMYGLSANYALTDNLTVRGGVENTTYTVGGISTTFTPVTLDLIYSQSIAGMIHPYAGAGVSYNTVNAGGAVTQTSGAQAEAGIKFEINGFSAGLEYRYMLVDLNNGNSGASTFDGYMTGAFTQSLNF